MASPTPPSFNDLVPIGKYINSDGPYDLIGGWIKTGLNSVRYIPGPPESSLDRLIRLQNENRKPNQKFRSDRVMRKITRLIKMKKLLTGE